MAANDAAASFNPASNRSRIVPRGGPLRRGTYLKPKAFRKEAGHLYRSESGRDSDLMSATRGLLLRIEAMMFRLGGLVKRGWI